MPKTSLEIIMSEDLKHRLQMCAKQRGQSLQEFAQEALYTYVEDIEDGVVSDVVLSEEGLKYLLPEGVDAIGLDHRVFEERRKTA